MLINKENYLEILLKKLRQKRSTLLGISPVSEYTIVSSLRAASRLIAPILFVASLNQVDIDGGYTGFTPISFVKYVNEVMRAQELGARVIFQVDHCGPWLKDEHIAKNYSYDEALNAILKSIEEFIKAGFSLVHIDTTIDVEKPDKTADFETAIKRTIQLIELVEDIAYSTGMEVKYEIGSDRWGYKPIDIFDKFISRVIAGLKRQRIDPRKVFFVVVDVGTKVRPGNRVDESTLTLFSRTALQYDYFLKIHSGDYLENPSILPRCNVGGVNIGPMFADIQYQIIREAILELGKHELLDKLSMLITRSDKLGKYVRKGKVENYEMGIASRYIWSSPEAREIINIIEHYGVPVARRVLKRMENVIEFYMKELNLQNL